MCFERHGKRSFTGEEIIMVHVKYIELYAMKPVSARDPHMLAGRGTTYCPGRSISSIVLIQLFTVPPMQ